MAIDLRARAQRPRHRGPNHSIVSEHHHRTTGPVRGQLIERPADPNVQPGQRLPAVEVQSVGLGAPTPPLVGPTSRHLILGQTLPRTHMHLAKTIIDPGLNTNQRRQRSRRRQRTTQWTRHDRSDTDICQVPRRRLRRWLGPRLDIHIEPARHPLLNIERRPTMTHQIDQLHATIVPRVANGVPILKPRTGQRHQHQVWK